MDNFDWNIIEECDSKDKLDEMEVYHIKCYDTLRPNGYNLT